MSQNNPVFTASAFPIRSKRQIVSRKGYKCCSTIGQQSLPGLPVSAESALYSQFLFPFVDVFCFVYHGTRDLEDIVQHLVNWVDPRGKSTTSYIPIIITAEAVPLSRVSEDLFQRLAACSTEPVPEFFSALKFVKIKKDKLISPKGRSELYRHLFKASGRIRRKRAERGLVFSGNHLTAFAEIAFHHLISPQSFDFLKASRLLNPVATDLGEHLANFVTQVQRAHDVIGFAAETIASSLLLDHYPPGMHGIATYFLKSEPR